MSNEHCAVPGVEAMARKQPSSTGRLSSDCSLLTPARCLCASGWLSSPGRNHARDTGVPCGTLGKGWPTLTFKPLLSFLHHIQLPQQPATSPAHLMSTSVRDQRPLRIPALPLTTRLEVGTSTSTRRSFKQRGVPEKMVTNVF